MALLFGHDEMTTQGSGNLMDTGFTMRGDIDMDSHKISNLPTQTDNDEPVTKEYADTHYYTGTSASGAVTHHHQVPSQTTDSQ